MLKINLIKLHKSWFKVVPKMRKLKNLSRAIYEIQKSEYNLFTLACNGYV